jgi:hypothetical protein
MKHLTHAIYQRGADRIQNTAYIADDGSLWASYQVITADQYCAEKNASKAPDEPDFEILPIDEAMTLVDAAQRAKYLRDWAEITEEEWRDALEVLPPEKWRTVAGVEIFRMSEYLTGNITAHYARLGESHFVANRCANMSYEDIAAEVSKANQNPAKQPQTNITMKSAVKHRITLTITANGFQQIWDGSQFVNAVKEGWDHDGELCDTPELASRWHDATNAIEPDEDGEPEGTLSLTNEAHIWNEDESDYDDLPEGLEDELCSATAQEIELWTL